MKRIIKGLALFLSLILVVGFILPVYSPVTASAARTIEINDAGELGDALDAAELAAGDVLDIKANITDFDKVVDIAVDGEVEIKLNNFTLTITVPAPDVVLITDSVLKITGPGTLNIVNSSADTDSIGVAMDGTSGFTGSGGAVINITANGASIDVLDGTATLSNVTGNINRGPLTVGIGATVTVTGGIRSSGAGLNVTDPAATVTVTGDITAATGTAVSNTGGTVTITGNITAAAGTGVSSNGGKVTVTGRVSAAGSGVSGVHAWNNAEVRVTSSVTATGTSSIGVQLGSATGTVGTENEVRVSGAITAPVYVRFQSGATQANRTAAQFEDVITLDTFLYRVYSVEPGPGELFVRAGAVPTVTGNGTVPIPAIQSGNTITLVLDQAKITELITTATGTNPVRIDLASASATTLSAPTDFFKQLNDANKTLRVDLPEGTIVFSSGAMTTLAGRTGTSIDISLHVQNLSSLTTAQRNAVNVNDIVYSVTVTSGTAITNFGGSLTIILPYSGPYPAEIFHLSTTGILTRVTSTTDQANGLMTFSRNTLSIFVIRYNAPNVPQTGDTENIILLAIIAFVAVSGLAALVIFRKRLPRS